jgi:hypothetical protein
VSDLIVLNDTVVLGGLLAVLVFGGLRFLDDIVDVLVGDQAAADRLDESDAP